MTRLTIRERIIRKSKYYNNKFGIKKAKKILKKNGFQNQSRFEKNKIRIQEKVKKGENIKVVFIGYQDADSCDVFTSIYKEFVKKPCFEVTVVIAPYTHDTKSNMILRQKRAEEYLKELGIDFKRGYDEENDSFLILEDRYDIAFFEVEYSWMREEFQARHFISAISYLIPYGEFLADNIISAHFISPMIYDVYKVLPPSRQVYEMIAKVSFIGEKNIYPFLGNSKLDLFFEKNYKPSDVWKIKDRKIKRLIWAPHHVWANYSNFPQYCDFMFDIAKRYQDRLQIAFKPHPALAESLVRVLGWTPQKVAEYYEKWCELQNAQLENGKWIDLFLTSDAMIMDSIGFMAEYSVTMKPSCVLYREDNQNNREMHFSQCGEEIFQRLYHAKNNSEIVAFLENVVFENNDYMATERNSYILSQYEPPLLGSAGRNICEKICNEIGVEE